MSASSRSPLMSITDERLISRTSTSDHLSWLSVDCPVPGSPIARPMTFALGRRRQQD